MSEGCFEADFFCLEDLSCAPFPHQYQHRKPSADDLLSELLASPGTQTMTSMETPRPKLKKLVSEQVTERKPKKKRDGEKASKEHLQRGHWKQEENKRYHWFLELHSSHFLNRHMRRMDKIFKTMEKFVGTREAEQCRSHHQKMEKKHGNFTTILRELRRQHYAVEDAETVMADIVANGIECSVTLLTQTNLETGIAPVTQSESEPEMIEKSEEEYLLPQTFVDPLAEEDREPFLELLIL